MARGEPGYAAQSVVGSQNRGAGVFSRHNSLPAGGVRSVDPNDWLRGEAAERKRLPPPCSATLFRYTQDMLLADSVIVKIGHQNDVYQGPLE
jgi:hypothetical protein